MTNDAIISVGLKAASIFGSFVAGIVATTWAVAKKHQEMDDRLAAVEARGTALTNLEAKLNKHLPAVERHGAVLLKLEQKLDDLPDRLDQRVESRFIRVHERIDRIAAGGASNSPAPPAKNQLDEDTLLFVLGEIKRSLPPEGEEADAAGVLTPHGADVRVERTALSKILKRLQRHVVQS